MTDQLDYRRDAGPDPRAGDSRPSGPRGQGGPPLGVLAVVFTALFVAGLVLSVVLAGGATFPSPFGPVADTLAYFRDHQSAVQVSALFQFAAAIPLAIYAATATARLHRLGVRAPGAFITLAGGLLAAAFLAGSGLVTWVLSRPEVAGEPALVRALQDLAFATGGPGHVVPLGLLVAGIAVPGMLARLLPRWLTVAGLVIAALAELATLTLLVSDAAFLLPIARFTGLAWLVIAGFLLPRTRKERS
ncbi:DUF4386 domain-containing protein [Actinocrispum wychmicini]|uniref:DUF4386 domain-containing protein n=1 Tax=Actinocrispum wychmicini TaxID=1213861 RepID=A0A4R2JIL2_9PSEU|nr:DUF4386 domain-containing protein [Actinocrispum wychmicini]TCO59741.1 hypothetical protein EV192_104584 [Actinocrispum wychmicini]